MKKLTKKQEEKIQNAIKILVDNEISVIINYKITGGKIERLTDITGGGYNEFINCDVKNI